MLKKLKINNFALIEKAVINFKNSMTSITGESGSGKTTFIDIIELLSGKRAKSSLIRKHKENAMVDAVFLVENNSKIFEILDEREIPYKNNEVVIHREITSDGKNIIKINNKPSSLKILKEISVFLIKFYHQFNSSELLENDNYLSYVDNYDIESIKKTLDEYRNTYSLYTNNLKDIKNTTSKLDEIENNGMDIEDQIEEIKKANLKEDEDIIVEEQIDNLVESNNRKSVFLNLYNSLKNDNENISSNLKKFQNEIESFQSLSKKESNVVSNLIQINDLIDSVSLDASSITNENNDNNKELIALEERQTFLENFKNKYSMEINEIISYFKDISQSSNLEETLRNKILDLKLEKKNLSKKLKSLSEKLHEIRVSSSKNIENNLNEQFSYLSLSDMNIKISVDKNNKLNRNGADNVVFKIKNGSNENYRDLSDGVSGGELSRILLSFSVVFGNNTDYETIIFDEIDSGVSGKTAQLMANTIKKISEKKQVIAITHMAQTAAIANEQLAMVKESTKNNVESKIYKLNNEERVENIANMIGSSGNSDNAKNFANDLLKK